jgi:molecular chaperone DnaK (HSP70)
MKRVLILTVIAALTGCARHETPPSGIVVESQSPAIGADSTLSESIGIETLGGVFTPLLEPGVSVPCRKSEIFSTAVDNQDQIMIVLCRGNASMAKDNKRIGHFQIQGIQPAPRGTPQIQVSFIVTKTDIMLDAKDIASGKAMRIAEIKESSQQ